MMSFPIAKLRNAAPALLVLSMLGNLIPSAASAADAAPAAPAAPAKKERKATGSMSEATYRQLEKIYKLMADKKDSEALAKLQELYPRANGDYERCLVLQTEGYVYANQNNYKKAIEFFEQALALEALPQQPYEQLIYNIGQMDLATDQYDKAIVMLERYLAEATFAKPPPDAHIVLASAYAQKKRFGDAIKQVDIALSEAKTVKEPWLQLKLALHFELKQYPQCAETLLQLISVAPTKKDYWKQLSSIFFELKDDKQSLSILALADRQGFLTEEREFKNLASVYFLLEIPYKAALIIQRGLDQKILQVDEKTMLQLSDAWLLAREYDKSAAALKKSAEITGKGDLYYRLAQLYVQDEKWKPALEALNEAQKKGVSKQGQAAFLAGVVSFQLGDHTSARKNLTRAMESDDTRKQAQQWLNYLAQQEGQPAVEAPPADTAAPADAAPAAAPAAPAAPAPAPKAAAPAAPAKPAAPAAKAAPAPAAKPAPAPAPAAKSPPPKPAAPPAKPAPAKK